MYVLATNSAHVRMRTHCTALSGIHDKHDVHLLSDHRRECLKLTIQAAAFLVGSIGNGGQAANAEYGKSLPCFSNFRPRLTLAQEIIISVSTGYTQLGKLMTCRCWSGLDRSLPYPPDRLDARCYRCRSIRPRPRRSSSRFA